MEHSVPSLHDCLSLGEVEMGLSSSRKTASIEEVHRLPILLRLLSSSRPLSMIPSFPPPTNFEEDEGCEPSDKIIQDAVNRLEDRAALYSVAEGIEVVTSHLAPSVCSKISLLPTLKKDEGGTLYDIDELSVLAAHPFSSSSKRRTRKTSQHGETAALSDNEEVSSDDDMDVSQIGTARGQNLARDRDSYLRISSEDSQEATVIKTLSELTTLVVQSLKAVKREDDGDGNNESILSLAVDDSILAEEGQRSKTVDNAGGAMVGCDLGSTVAALMHHAPVLRYDHVASALCRAAVPQTTDLIARMGANCPAAVPCLLSGCIDVYHQAQKSQQQNQTITNVAKSAASALANLSPREKARVRTTLQCRGIWIDLQLQLAISEDPLVAACLIMEHLNRRRNESSSSQEIASLSQTLQRSPEILWSILSCFGKKLSLKPSFGKESDGAQNQIVWGQTNLLLTAYARLLLCVPLEKDKKRSEKWLNNGVIAEMMMSLMTTLRETAVSQSCVQDELRSLDRLYALLLAVFVIIIVLSSEYDVDGNITGNETFVKYLQDLFAIPEFSRKSTVLMCRVSCALKFNDTTAILLLLEDISGCSGPRNIIDGFVERLSVACGWASNHLNLDTNVDQITREDLLLVDQSAVLLMIQALSPEDCKIQQIKEILTGILRDASKSSIILRSTLIVTFCHAIVSVLLKANIPKIPLLLPIDLERLGSGISLHFEGAIEDKESQFLLNLLYCFEFLKEEPHSPFAFEPRSLPLAAVYTFCDTNSSVNGALREKLKLYIIRFCPEIPTQTLRYKMLRPSSYASTTQNSIGCSRQKALKNVFRKSVSVSEWDPCGLIAEKEFILASEDLSEPKLITATTNAILSESRALPLSYSYSTLCRDPLVLLKCSLTLWRREGLRRILLWVLTCLLNVNDLVIRQLAPDEDSRDELLASRNEVLARCLISASLCSASHNGNCQHYCSMTVGLIRKSVAGQRGLVAMLIKQTLPENSFDWLVEFVPETIEDANPLLGVLSERSSLSPAERLIVADSILRIAIAYGYRNSADAEALVYTALSQIITSFFLIIGPTGVPVSSLVGEGTGVDATKASRKAAFRMLKCLLKVRGYRPGVRNECSLVLQKLAGLCKGEGVLSGASGAFANRQKAFLKEFLDSISKVANAMGVGIHL